MTVTRQAILTVPTLLLPVSILPLRISYIMYYIVVFPGISYSIVLPEREYTFQCTSNIAIWQNRFSNVLLSWKWLREIAFVWAKTLKRPLYKKPNAFTIRHYIRSITLLILITRPHTHMYYFYVMPKQKVNQNIIKVQEWNVWNTFFIIHISYCLCLKYLCKHLGEIRWNLMVFCNLTCMWFH